MLTISVSIDGLERKLHTLAETAKDLEPALRILDTYLRGRVAQRFSSEGPGWPARKESTEAGHHREAQVQALAVHRLRRKLQRELRRAQRRLRYGKGTVAAVDRRYAVLKEFERQVAGGILDAQTGKDRRVEKSVRGLHERFGRAEAQASGRLLGRMASSIASSVRRGSLTVYSRVPWAGIHNEGGIGGHGAEIPPRPFLFLEPEDIDLLAELLANRMLLAVG